MGYAAHSFSHAARLLSWLFLFFAFSPLTGPGRYKEIADSGRALWYIAPSSDSCFKERNPFTMALPSTIYRATIQLADTDRGVYESIQTTAAQHPSETAERLVARLLALAIFHEPGLSFTKGLSAADEPDVWVVGPDGRPALWVEVGLPDADRIVKAGRHAGRVCLLACGRALANWEQQHLPKLAKIANLTVASIDQAFIATVASTLERAINWSITITEGTLYLAMGNDTHETDILCKKNRVNRMNNRGVT